MKPAAHSKKTHHVIETLLTGLVAASLTLLIAGAGWVIWQTVMEMMGDNWPEWLRLCGAR
jgi:hypothetical protein